MNEMLQNLQDDHDRWLKLLGADQPNLPIKVSEVLKAHYLIADFFMRSGEGLLMAGPRSADLLISAVMRQVVSFGGRVKWNDPFERCATLFFGIVKNHSFHDANKRTALLIALYNLDRLGRIPSLRQSELEVVALRTAADSLSMYPRFHNFRKHDEPAIAFLADFWRRNSEKLDSRLRAVSYRELNGILKRYGFEFHNPSGNWIDVVRFEEERFGFLGRKSRVVPKKIIQVGFPRWGEQVGFKALRSILNATGLTPENGISSEMIFGTAESLASLIQIYEGPLKRLKNK